MEDKGKLLVSFWLNKDENMRKLNRKVFNKKEATDIITFPINQDLDDKIQYLGELVINQDEVVRNSEKYKTGYALELARVITHGVLHLLGYKDTTKKGIKTMKAIENSVIKKLCQNHP